MHCRKARRLLDRGVRPGFLPATRAALGLHLTHCAPCRAYQPHPDDQLLQALLNELPATATSTPSARTQWRPMLRVIGLALCLLTLLWVASVVGRTALALITISQNVQAMRLATATIGRDLRADLSPGPTIEHTTLVTLAGAPTLSVRATMRPTSDPAYPPVVPILRPTSAVTAPPDDAAINVLLLGSDRRPGEGGPARNDAIVVARLDPAQRRVALLSLPRDLIVTIPGYGAGRINSASVYGEQNGEPGGGVGLMRRTVSRLLDLPIDYVVQVDFTGFIGAVDAIGGITIDVPQELYDPAYPTMDYGYTVAHFMPGRQQMDGATALMYSRIRHMDSDFERMRRQQSVLLAIMSRLREQNVIEQVQSIATITTALRGYVQTDLPQDSAISLAWAFRNLSPDSVERYSLDANMITIGADPNDPYAEYARPGAIRQLVQMLLNSSATR